MIFKNITKGIQFEKEAELFLDNIRVDIGEENRENNKPGDMFNIFNNNGTLVGRFKYDFLYAENNISRFVRTFANMDVDSLNFQNEIDTIIYNNLKAVEKMVRVSINPDDLNNLKNNKYSLCFAKKVGDEDYNVVWRADKAFLQNNKISWTPQYKIFGSNTFENAVKVEVSTDLLNIGIGEQTTLTANGLFTTASTSPDKTSITLNNEFGSIHPGLYQISTGGDNKPIASPIYVAKESIVLGKTSLKPVDKVLVWFEQHIETSTMFSDSRSKSIELDLTESSEMTVKYENQEWKKV
ncbi:MAG: hypothetical protein RUMPE_01039 [Eubacteriales bacterium SKADARSKE-1]|nr:hypothetical protein [Eubacteriales bacterium SKADARSKE-1]